MEIRIWESWCSLDDSLSVSKDKEIRMVEADKRSFTEVVRGPKAEVKV